jgi:hypothetical protein
VGERVADGFEAVAEIAGELFGSETFDRLQNPIARPIVIVE